MDDHSGHALAGQALVSDQAAARLAAPRFDPSRRSAVWDAIGRSWAIKAASERATEARTAADWLFEYGHNCVGSDAAQVMFTASFAGSCVGSKEAGRVIKSAIIAMLPQIIDEAKRMVLRDMDELLDLLPARDSDGSGEAGETHSGSTVGDSAGPKDIAQGGPDASGN